MKILILMIIMNQILINSMNKKIKNQNQYSPKNNKRKMNSINNLIFRYNYDFDLNQHQKMMILHYLFLN